MEGLFYRCCLYTRYELDPGSAKTSSRVAYPKFKKDDDIKKQADNAATFWSNDYYSLVFPLRFGKKIDGSTVKGVELFPTANPVLQAGPLRSKFLEEDKLPPLLPADQSKEGYELLADFIVLRTAVLNVLLRQKGLNEEDLHTLRLAF